MADAGFRTLEGIERREVIDSVRDGIVLLFADGQMSGSTDGFARAPWRRILARNRIVAASGLVKPRAGDLSEKAAFRP